MKKAHLAYWLVIDGHLFDDNPDFIRVEKTSILSEFDQKQLTFGRGRLKEIWPKDV